MSALGLILFGISCAFIGAGVTTAVWTGKFRRHISWWRDHCERCERENKVHIDAFRALAKRSMELNSRYAAYLNGKIVIDDLLAGKRRPNGQA